MTARRRLPEPSVASAYFDSWNRSFMLRFGRNVLLLLGKSEKVRFKMKVKRKNKNKWNKAKKKNVSEKNRLKSCMNQSLASPIGFLELLLALELLIREVV